MQKVLIFLFLIFSQGLYGQFYGHKIFEVGDENLNVSGIFFDSSNNRAYIPVIYPPGDTSTIITIDSEGNSRLDFEIPAFLLPKYSFTQMGGGNYFYGKNNAIQNDLQVIKTDMVNQTVWREDFRNSLDFSFPIDILNMNNYLYITSVNERTEPYHRRINVKKVDTLGQEIWSRNYNNTSYYAYTTQSIVSSDNNILLSAIVQQQIFVGSPKSQLTKINDLGNIIWEVSGVEKIPNGAVRADLVELSNGNLVQLYEVDKFDDFAYRIVYNPFPVRMDWYDANGNFLFYKYIEYPSTEQFVRGDVTTGKGDYFFVTGSHSDNDIPVERYGVVTKFDNQGDTIWTKQYYHPDYPTLDDFRTIRNLVELDNGDLLLMGMIESEGSINAWFMRVNEHGCFGTATCDDLVTSVETDIDLSLLDIKIFPNPATDILRITSAADRPIQGAKLYDFSGQTLVDLDLPSGGQSNIEISVAEFPAGNYILSLELKDGKVVTELVSLL